MVHADLSDDDALSMLWRGMNVKYQCTAMEIQEGAIAYSGATPRSEAGWLDDFDEAKSLLAQMLLSESRTSSEWNSLKRTSLSWRIGRENLPLPADGNRLWITKSPMQIALMATNPNVLNTATVDSWERNTSDSFPLLFTNEEMEDSDVFLKAM